MSDVTLSLNGENRRVQAPVLAEALEEWGYQAEDIAVAVNGEFVPRSRYTLQTLQTGDCVDVVGRVQGG